ncbi:MAG: exo-alpha-sialidase [Verrucomicrobia bacterium]|nr:exo-alpha-sialidase [Verrucomicrobiota bacterium]
MNTPEIPVSWRPLFCGAMALLLGAVSSAREHVPLTVPFHKFSQTLIASDDHGATWRFVRDLTTEFGGIPINESALIPWRDGWHYLVGRNWTQPLAANARAPMQLCWFRFSPETLALETCVALDNAERNNVVDGYYATAHWRERDGVGLLNIVTYKRADFVTAQRTRSFHDPDLVRLEFVWDEVK